MKKKNGIKDIIHQAHLWLGLISGIVVVIVSLTGALYVFEEECRDIFQHKYFHVSKPGTTRLSIEEYGAFCNRSTETQKRRETCIGATGGTKIFLGFSLPFYINELSRQL